MYIDVDVAIAKAILIGVLLNCFFTELSVHLMAIIAQLMATIIHDFQWHLESIAQSRDVYGGQPQGGSGGIFKNFARGNIGINY